MIGALILSSEASFAIITADGDLALKLKDRPITSIIVKFNKNSSLKAWSMQDVSNFLSQKTNLSLNPEKKMSNGAYVFNISGSSLKSLSTMSSAQFNKQLQTKLDELKKDSNIKYADLNGYAYMQKTPTDSRYNEQWHYYETDGGANLPEAWDITTGSDVVVGVVDTGIVQHEELKDKILPGKNFVSDDEKNEKNDPTDRGGDTSFHGTHVAGTIAALAEHSNETGVVSGVSWGAKVLPARVLGDNGTGRFSDIIEGIRWVAGLGEKSAPTPAKVINMSLGGFGTCSGSLQETVDELNKKGVTMVVAAGNSNLPASFFVPANCKGVVVVGAVNRKGEKAYYSNYGKNTLTIAAPGGERKKKTDPEINMVLSLGAPGEYQFLQGTSMASPHVAGIIALMYTLNPDLTSDQVIKYIQKASRGTVMDVGIIDAKKTLELVKAGPLPEEPKDPKADPKDPKDSPKEEPKQDPKDEPAEEPEEL